MLDQMFITTGQSSCHRKSQPHGQFTIKILKFCSVTQHDKTFYSSEVHLSVVDDYDNISRMNDCTTDSEGT